MTPLVSKTVLIRNQLPGEIASRRRRLRKRSRIISSFLPEVPWYC